MTDRVYTIGYTGRKPEEIKQILDRFGADLFDIRYSATSMVAYWRHSFLTKFLGKRYLHVASLGNVNYKNGQEIKIANFEVGLRVIRNHSRPVVLMCACRDYGRCHRKVVAQALIKNGFEVEEIGRTVRV